MYASDHKQVKHGAEILRLLQAVMLPRELAFTAEATKREMRK